MTRKQRESTDIWDDVRMPGGQVAGLPPSEDFTLTPAEVRDHDDWFDPNAYEDTSLSQFRETNDRLDRLIEAQERTNDLLERLVAKLCQ